MYLKKKLLECSIHGLTLHRCKRQYWHTDKQKWASEYTEKCFKCISEGRIAKKPVVSHPRKKHVKI